MKITPEQYDWIYKQKWDEDARQEALIKLLEYDPPNEGTDYKKLFYTVYRHTLIDMIRKESNREDLRADNPKRLEQLHNDQDVFDPYLHIKAKDLARKITALTEAQIEVVQFLMEGLTLAEIAAKLGVNPNAIYQRVFAAKKELENE